MMAEADLAVIESVEPDDPRDRCPKCGGGSVARAKVKPGTFKGYGPLIAVCKSCKALWEAIDHDLIWDPDDPLCAFSDPCDNCAFRPGSKEQRDKEEWAAIKRNVETSGGFYCHKGVPIEAGAKHGFAYPHAADGKPEFKKLRYCRGWLNAWGAKMDKEPAA
jgi:transcription elongation factor Elf1